ncbi:glycosyltransferase [Thermococcus pacificus]|uniref:Glycosyltransferase n=1 Tax=Thermococcus pacificus TaxID=71998 RepID=A0A218PA24_9EURY|nr:glycosyltransferase [Thermococcus pacificus]ASJ07624.1 glycosyltransferase [Thermococcus pacificus]
MKIIALPAFRNRKINPYNSLLYENLIALGIRVEEFSVWKLVRGGYDIWHIHWPELVLNTPSYLMATLRAKAFLSLMGIARKRGIKIVWTVHNLRSHEGFHPKLEERFWERFLGMVDGHISLTSIGQEELFRTYPQLRRVPGFVIPHGHYRDVYPNNISRKQARALLGLPMDSRVILFIGQIRKYKNLPSLIRAFNSLPEKDVRLVIAGKPVDRELTNQLFKLVKSDSRIMFHPKFIPSEEIQVYLNSADLVVLPYSEILNSGSALLALSFDRPVLAPAKGSMIELRDSVGKEWVMLYTGELTGDTLSNALEWAILEKRPARAPLDRFSWDNIARETLKAYKKVLERE